MKKLMYFLALSTLIACNKYKQQTRNDESSFTCDCESKIEFIDHCKVDSSESKQLILAKSRGEAEKYCKTLSFDSVNVETKISKKCELR